MKQLLAIILCSSLSFGAIETISSFEADFSQTVIDDKNSTLTYSGHIAAKKPQSAVWNYYNPIKKDIFISKYRVVVIEPEIEQVIIRKVESNFDFFILIKNAKKIAKNTYEANYKETKFKIIMKEDLIESISYKDEFENDVKITFINQKQNKIIDEKVFFVNYGYRFIRFWKFITKLTLILSRETNRHG